MVSLPEMETTRKITVHVPASLLDKARQTTGSGITATVRQGLQLVAATDAYRRLRALRGEMKLSIDLDELREDRH
jgi:Arc/MetJ-type ribon-helix-helix transcriptional regulator